MGSDPSEDARPTPTFQGRLKLENFMFDDASAPRRSTRSSTAALAAAAAPSTLSKQPSARAGPKRKAPPGVDDANHVSEAPSPSASSTAVSGTAAKRARQKSSYAPPSTYAHLPLLPDAMGPNLLILFIGLNPGIQTARTGHAYAHPTNHFWRLLHSSGITPRQCSPTEDGRMPALYSLGLTNIVARPSRNGAELSKEEMDAGVAILEEKVRRWRPEVVCVVGKSIWESLWRVRHGRAIRASEFSYGWQGEDENMGILEDGTQKEEEKEEGVMYGDDWKGARLFVATSTSGLAATLKPQEKQDIWRQLGEWTEKRRTERTAAASATTAAQS
ncbi:hydrolase-like protein [Staphylotrichum tortipilum]|uniref:Hydrolase-like protein n=1 Tax=Staphylotrichum tortipilum TaxID=2831512 RepID=A0AAN6MW55_9PEZI|nr:hydrolase-like protein [Staphylotrichum longicolle]KAK3907065.1 hydrolase-like protein [Staphylotrichum longicolle]